MAKTARSAGSCASTIVHKVDFNSEELASGAEKGNVVLYREPDLDFNPSFGTVLRAQKPDVVDVQNLQNIIAKEIEVSVGQRMLELEREPEGVTRVGPESWCMFQPI